MKYLNTHPGSHLNEITEDECIANIAECINKAIDATENIVIVLENTSGQGSNMGYKFEHLGKLLKNKNKERIGACIDTCHTITAGYELKDEAGYKKLWMSLKNMLALNILKEYILMTLNLILE